MNDTITVSPFATPVLPWNVAVSIDGGTGTDRITYNNVAGLLDSTAVTATGPQAGHIDSPGVTSALNSQLVSFTAVEKLTVNANPGEDENLTINLRDTSVPDTANLLFDPTPGADDLQLVGLFDMVIDTDNYVGLTLNGRGGDDTFNITPGPIPVFVDGGDPIGATAGDALNFNPAGSYVLEPGPHNDEGGLNAAGARRISADADGNNRTATFAATNDPAFPQFNRLFVRVKSAGDQPSLSVNHYDFANLSGAGSGIPGTSTADTNGPQVTGVNITNNPLTPADESAYSVFDPKPAAGPTPLVPSMVIHFADNPARAPGFLYSAIDPHLFAGPAGKEPAMGLFSVVGDLVGNVPIKDVVLTNNPVFPGHPATATVTIIFDLSSPAFAGGVPDDRCTLTILGGLSDPSGTKLDGESTAAQPTTAQSFPSGDGQPGGDFVARFTVDSRPEIGTFGDNSNKTFIDLNGNGTWDPQGSGDTVNHDNNFIFGQATDTLFAGDFAAADAPTANGYDKLGAYGKVNGQNRFLLDLNGDGYPDLTVFPTLQINGTPVAGDFAPGHPGQEIGIFSSNTWYLDSNGDNNIDSTDLTVKDGLKCLPIVGDFDGDGKVDLATYNSSSNTFYFDLASNGYGQLDATINFGFPIVNEMAVAADMNRDGVTDVGLFVPRSIDSSETLNHAFNQKPFSNDRFFTFGDSFYQPIVGNFDPRVAGGPIGITAVVDNGGQPSGGNGATSPPLPPLPATSPITVGTGPGAVAEVKVLDGKTDAVLFDVKPFDDFTGGVFVAAGDVTGDGKADLIITPDLSGGPRVEIYTGGDFHEIANFFGIDDPNFRGGARAALGDINGDGFTDLVISAGFGGGPRVSVYDGKSLAQGQQVRAVPDFFLFEQTLRNGAYVTVGDVNGDGFADIIGGGGPGGGPRVLAISGQTLLSGGPAAAINDPVANFFSRDATSRSGIRVAAKNLDGDNQAYLIVGDGKGGSHVTAYAGADLASGAASELFTFDAVPDSLNGAFVGQRSADCF